MNLGRNIGYVRWYDRLPELSRAVRLLEKMSKVEQQLIADSIVQLQPLHEVSRHTDGFKRVGTEKLLGLMRSKVKRRWYDQDPTIHQAFNCLYLMDDEMRYEMAVKILICQKALELVDVSEQNRELGIRLTRTIFDRPLYDLIGRTHFIFQSAEESKAAGVRVALTLKKEKPAPASELPPEKKERDNTIQISDNSDMKIVRLKRVSEVKMG